MKTLTLCVCLLAAVVIAQEPLGKVTTLEAPEDHSIKSLLSEDVNLDGQPDLVLNLWGDGQRTLQVHLARPTSPIYQSQPDYTLVLTPDVCAYALGDVHHDPGKEVVLFSASGAFAWRPTSEEEGQRFVRLLTGAFLWQLPHRYECIPWQNGVRDLDGDGLDDLLLPRHGAYLLAFQERGVADVLFDSIELHLPGGDFWHGGFSLAAMRARGRASRQRMGERMRVSDNAVPPGPLLEVAEAVPAPQICDWDGDGDLDIVAQTPAELLVWPHEATEAAGSVRGFSAAPGQRHALPVSADRKRRLDVSYSAHLPDLTGDGRADCVMVAGDTESEDIRTQLLFYIQGRGQPEAQPLFGEKGVPQQLLLLDGFAGIPRFNDIDGNGLPDLVVGAMRPDLIDTMRASASQKLDIELYVFLNHDGRLARTPDLTLAISISADGLRNSRREIVSRFFGDVTGDGVRDLMLRAEPELLKVLMVRESEGRLSVESRALWEIRIDAEADLAVIPGPGAASDLLIIERTRLLHVRFP